MEHNINSLLGYKLEATDGIIGDVKDFYFDDQTWKIRYLIVKIEKSLSGRKVLISPDELVKTTWQNGLFPVNLTEKQISDSPDIDTDKPVSRQQEIELYGHYGWPEYWGKEVIASGNLENITPIPVTDKRELKDINAYKTPEPDLFLCSTARVTNYRIYANNGEIGHVNDFILDDKTWQMVFFVVDTQNWEGGKKVLIPVKHIKEVVWAKFEVFLDISLADVENSKLFKASKYKERETKNGDIASLPITPIDIH
jgi:sporulation protein YlmC with PRC-barrel domain